MNRQRVPAFVFACLTCAWTLSTLGCGGGGGGSPCTAKTPPNVAGQWAVSQVVASQDTCPSGLADTLISQIEGSVFQVTQHGGQVQLDDNQGDVFNGCVDEAGEVTASVHESGSSQGCNLSVTVDLSGNLSSSPTSVELAFAVQASGNCSTSHCMLTLDSQFTRTGSTALRPQAADTAALSFAQGAAHTLGQ